MTKSTMSFRRRFNMLGISEKMKTADQLGSYVTNRKMPGGREMTPDEFAELDLLLTWCQQNIFFGLLPNLSTNQS